MINAAEATKNMPKFSRAWHTEHSRVAIHNAELSGGVKERRFGLSVSKPTVVIDGILWAVSWVDGESVVPVMRVGK